MLDPVAGVAQRWTAGLEATRHPIVVLLDGDVIVSAHWLDPVVEPFLDPSVVAAGPAASTATAPSRPTCPTTP